MARDRHTVENDGIELAMTASGTGPDVLFVHGLGSAQVLWEPIIGELCNQYRCWNLDLRGHGDSGRAPGGYSRETYESDVAAALDYIGRPTAGIGHSLGGGSLTGVAIAGHPQLRAVYAADSSILPRDPGAGGVFKIFEKQLEMMREFQPENRPIDDYEAIIGAAPYVGGGTNRDNMLPEQLRGRAQSVSQLDPGCFEHAISRQGNPSAFTPADPVIDVPFRVLGADPALGASVRPDWSDRIRAFTPHAEVESLKGVGHQMMMIRGYDQIILDDITSWLADVVS